MDNRHPTAFALEDLVTELEGGYRTRLFGTGLAAVAQTLLAYLRPGDQVLISDAAPGPGVSPAFRHPGRLLQA